MDDFIIHLPCGFTTQFKRLNTDEIEIKCIECDSHTLNIKECLNMPLNQLNLKAKELEMETKRLEDLKLNFDQYQKDPQYYIHESLEKVKNKLNLRREEVKLDLCNKIDEHYENLWQRVTEQYTNKQDEFINDVKWIEKVQIKLSDHMKFKDKIVILDTNLEKVKAKIELIEKSIRKLEAENVEFIPNSNEFDIKELFGDLRFKLDAKEIDVSRYKLSDEFNTLQMCITDLKSIGNDKVLTSSSDKTIKLWDIKIKKCLNQFNGHTDRVLCICVLSNTRFATCAEDQTIKIWNIKTGKCIQSWICNAAVLKNAKNGCFYSGEYGRPFSIHKWDYNTDAITLDQLLIGHKSGVYCLEETLDGTLISGSLDNTIKLWNENGTCLKTLTGHTDDVYALKILNKDLLVSGSKDKTIKIWNIKSGGLIKTFSDNTSAIFNINQLNDDLLLSGCQDGTIKVWDLNSNECVKIIENKENNISNNCISFGIRLISNKSNDILAGFCDGTFKVWKLKNLHHTNK